MKLSLLVAAVAMTGMAPALVAPAAAQHTVVHERTVVRNGPAHRWHNRKVCRTEYRHHQRVRVCRTVRSR